jgi:hypothetical protein
MARRISVRHAIWRGSGPRSRARLPLTIRVLSALALVSGLTLIVGANAAQASGRPAAASSWTVEKMPFPKGATNVTVNSVSCISATHCVAVGTVGGKAATTSTLAEVWNGKSWQVQTTATPKGAFSTILSGVSCASTNRCIAAGAALYNDGAISRPLAEAWNGTSWRVQVTPAPKGATNILLLGVSCSSAGACTAAGDDNVSGRAEAVAERWNGKRWAVQTTATTSDLDAQFLAVSCPSASACVAVGYQEKTDTSENQLLAEKWNGTTWALQKLSLPSGSPGGTFNAVSCSSTTACTATGTSNTTGKTAPALAERWNGKAWRVQATPNPTGLGSTYFSAALVGVSCASATSCTAVGAYSPGGTNAYYAEVWNGTGWKLQTTPKPTGMTNGSLTGVSCIPDRCAAVGNYRSTGQQTSFAIAN